MSEATAEKSSNAASCFKVNKDSVISDITAKKGMRAKFLIDETFLPKGGSVGGHLTLWKAAELHDKLQFFPTLMGELNNMPDKKHTN